MFLRHELLSIFAKLMAKTERMKLENPEKEKIIKLLELSGALVAYEDILLGKKPEFFLQELGLQEFLSVSVMSHAKKIQRRNIKVSLPKTDHVIVIDRYYLEEALSVIVAKLLPLVSFLRFSFSPKTQILSIHHNFPDKKFFLQKPLAECQTTKMFRTQEIQYQLALYMFEMHGKKPIISKNVIGLALGK